MFVLEERRKAIRSEFEFLVSHDFSLVDESTRRDASTTVAYDSVSVKYETQRRSVEVRYFLRQNYEILNLDSDQVLENKSAVVEGTDISVTSKDHGGNQNWFSVNHYMRLIENEQYLTKFNTYRRHDTQSFDDNEFRTLLGNYRQLLETRFIDLIKGTRWISTHLDRLDGWIIEESGRIVLTELL